MYVLYVHNCKIFVLELLNLKMFILGDGRVGNETPKSLSYKKELLKVIQTPAQVI